MEEGGGNDVNNQEMKTPPPVEETGVEDAPIQDDPSPEPKHSLDSSAVIETIVTSERVMNEDDDVTNVMVIDKLTRSLRHSSTNDEEVKDDHIEAEMDSAFVSNDSPQVTHLEEPVTELNLDDDADFDDRLSDKISDDIALDLPSEISVSPLPNYADEFAEESCDREDDVESLSEVTSEKSKDADYAIDKSDPVFDASTPDGDVPEILDDCDFTAKLDQYVMFTEANTGVATAGPMTSSGDTDQEGMCEASHGGVMVTNAESSLETQLEPESEEASLVVQFEDSSRRTSDVSSLVSFQAIVVNDHDSPNRSRHDSGASSVSLPNEASDLAFIRDEAPTHITNLDWNSVRDKLSTEQDHNSDSTSEYELIHADCRASSVSADSNVDSDRTAVYSSDGANNNSATSANVLVMERHRNSSEIRNNIPSKGRTYIDQSDINNKSQNSAHIKKKSPGLAQRLDNPETENMVHDLSPGHNGPQLQDIRRKANELVHNKQNRLMDVDGMNENNKNLEVENEYDYIKIARFSSSSGNDGDSYVGRRLAYSNSVDSLRYKSAPSPALDDSPEKTIRNLPHRKFQPVELSAVADDFNDEMLTEIPLNAAQDNQKVEQERHFTLSPETTDCDSAEVESVLSEGPDQSSSGFPNVDDGLSSSQCSDNEDLVHDYQTPTSILRQKQKAGIRMKDLELPDNDDFHLIRNLSTTTRNRSVQTPECNGEQMEVDDTYSEGSGMSREALDLAMEDIKTAIKRSRSLPLKSPYHEASEESDDPVWIRRERDAELRRQEEMRRVRDQIERQQEEDFTRKQQHFYLQQQEHLQQQSQLQEGAPLQINNKHHTVPSEVDGDDKKLTLSQQSRHHDGKKYHKPRGDVDSDDDDVTMGWRKRGYQSLPADEPRANHVASDHLSSNDINMNRSSSQPISGRKQCAGQDVANYDTDEETDQLLDKEYVREQKTNIPELKEPPVNIQSSRRSKGREVTMPHPENDTVLIEGVLFRASYLGSTQLISEGQPSKAMRMMQAQEAVGRIKMPEGETQPSTEVDLFVSMEKIMVLNTNRQEIMMDHSLRTISYIADIGDLVVIMARRRLLATPMDDTMRRKRQSKIICHVFETEEAQLIAQSIGQAFQVAYMEFLKANGIEDPGMMKEMDYQEVLNQQEIFGEELSLFANREMQKEVIVPKLKGEALGVVIVESGWGSMVPTVVLANMSPIGAAARCGQLNIGDQIMSINGVSLVGLPLSSCITYIKASKNQTVVKLTVVQCPPVVEVCIKRPDVKYQLGFSVQNGVICSLLRGGIAERGGVRVGHRIIEINGSSVVAVAHEKIVNMLATYVGEIHMKTMPTSIFRLLTGQETPHYI